MPSNKELIGQATSLALGLSEEIVTDGLKNDQLMELVAGLQAKVDALPALPADFKRPSVDEYVAAGYTADGYESAMSQYDIKTRRNLAAAAALVETDAPGPQSPPPPVNATPTGDPPPPPVDGAAPRVETGAPPPPPEPPPPQLYAYQIAVSKALTTPRGVLGPGVEITAKDLSGGVEQLEALVTRGYVTKAAKSSKS